MSKENFKGLARIENKFIFNARYYMTASEQRIVLYLVSRLDPENQKDFHRQIIPIKEIETHLKAGSDKKWGSAYERLEALSDRLTDRKISFPTKFMHEGKPMKGHINWFQSVRPTTNDEGETSLAFLFSEDLKPYLLQLKEYVRVNGLEIAAMTNPHAMRTYTILLATRRKSRKYSEETVYEVDLEDFKLQLGIDGKYPKLKDFRKRVLDVICEQINGHSHEIEVSYNYVKPKRKVTGIKWFIKDKESQSKTKGNTKVTDFAPTQEEIETLTFAQKRAFDRLVKLGVKEGIAFKRIIPTILGSESVGYEDYFVTYAIKHFKEKSNDSDNAGTFVNWWLKKKIFDPKSDVFGSIMENLAQAKKTLEETDPDAFDNRSVAKGMTYKEFKEWFRGQ